MSTYHYSWPGFWLLYVDENQNALFWLWLFSFIGSIEHCDQHLCACLLTRVTRRHVSVTWLWRGHGDSVTAAHSNPSPSGGMFAANQVKIITVLRDISMFFSKPYPIFYLDTYIKSSEYGAIINTYFYLWFDYYADKTKLQFREGSEKRLERRSRLFLRKHVFSRRSTVLWLNICG